MHIALIGADFEESLSLGMIGAAAAQAGHRVSIFGFDDGSRIDPLAAAVVDARPDMIGISMQFQHRALEFLMLASALRELGFDGHITSGGQLATLCPETVLAVQGTVDSVVLHDGEHTIVDLLSALEAGSPLDGVPGLALPDGGRVRTTMPRPLPDCLDELPFPLRYREHERHVGVPFIPMLGSRGCWNACSFCSITTFYRDARRHGGGHTVRLRSPANIADEMAALWHGAGGSGVFCFHDDTLLLPRPQDTLRRLTALRHELDARGVTRAALIGKCRPDCVTPELMVRLHELGLVRVYVGVENASEAGAGHLRRRCTPGEAHAALEACQSAGVKACYNLLLFEPDATLDDVRANVAFIRAHADQPVNFCRAEPYMGTPLQRDLERRGIFAGGPLGWNYRIADDPTELLFRITAAAFRERNFAPAGVANRYMGLDYCAKLLDVFHEPGEANLGLQRRAHELLRRISLDTAAWLDEAIELAGRPCGTADDRDAIERATIDLGLRIAAADAVWHRELDGTFAAMEGFATRACTPPPPQAQEPPRSHRLRDLALGTSLALSLAACQRRGAIVVDPAVPADASTAGPPVVPPPRNPPERYEHICDPPPPPSYELPVRPPDQRARHPKARHPRRDAGAAAPVDAAAAPVPSPRDAGAAPPPRPRHYDNIDDPPPADRGHPVRIPLGRFRDTSIGAPDRSPDLPLFQPPQIVLHAEAGAGGAIRVRAEVMGPVTLRWFGDGRIQGEGPEIAWIPDAPDAQLRAAARGPGGVAVATLRAAQLPGRRTAQQPPAS